MWDGKYYKMEEQKGGCQLHAMQDRERQYANMAEDPGPKPGR